MTILHHLCPFTSWTNNLWEWVCWPRLKSSALSFTLLFGEQADGEKVFSSSGGGVGGWYCVHSVGLRRRERRNESGIHVAFISYHITVALFCLSVPRCLPSCDFPTIYLFTPTGFCSITLSVPFLHLDYLFHIIASWLAANPELSPCCVWLLAWGALITPSQPPLPNSVCSVCSPLLPRCAAINITVFWGFPLYPSPSCCVFL